MWRKATRWDESTEKCSEKGAGVKVVGKSRERRKLQGLGAEREQQEQKLKWEKRKQPVRQNQTRFFSSPKCFLLSPAAVCSGGNDPAEPNSSGVGSQRGEEGVRADRRGGERPSRPPTPPRSEHKNCNACCQMNWQQPDSSSSWPQDLRCVWSVTSRATAGLQQTCKL